jgi:hypothetical protein
LVHIPSLKHSRRRRDTHPQPILKQSLRSPGRSIEGDSEAEFEAKIAALKASGEAGERDVIVCLRTFGA